MNRTRIQVIESGLSRKVLNVSSIFLAVKQDTSLRTKAIARLKGEVWYWQSIPDPLTCAHSERRQPMLIPIVNQSKRAARRQSRDWNFCIWNKWKCMEMAYGSRRLGTGSIRRTSRMTETIPSYLLPSAVYIASRSGIGSSFCMMPDAALSIRSEYPLGYFASRWYGQ